MKLIATRNFRNVGHRIQIENPTHAEQIDRGTVFEVGASDDLKSLRKVDRENAFFVAALIASGAAGEPTPELEAKIQKEIAAEKLREQRAAKADEVCRLENVGALVAQLGLATRKLQK